MRTKSIGLVVGGVAVLVLAGVVGALAGVPSFDGTEEDTDPIEFDQEEPIEIDPADAVVAGTADLEAGTELRVIAVSEGTENPFFAPVEATVEESGEFTAEFGLEHAEPGTEVDVEVTLVDDNETTLGTADGVIVEPSEDIDQDDSENGEAERIQFDGEEPLEFDPADPEISGTADVDEGTVLTVNVETVPGETDPFFKPTEVTVGEDGEFEAQFDPFRSMPEPGTEADVTVRIQGESETLGTSEVVVVEPSDN